MDPLSEEIYSPIRGDEVKLKILAFLPSQEAVTVSTLSKRVGSAFRTVKKALIFLEHIGVVQITKGQMGDRQVELISLTSLGKEISRNLKNRNGLQERAR